MVKGTKIKLEPPLYYGEYPGGITLSECTFDHENEDVIWFEEKHEGKQLYTSKILLAKRGIV